MTEAYIYDAIRTPRGKGKNKGSLHQKTPIKPIPQTDSKNNTNNNSKPIVRGAVSNQVCIFSLR